MHLQTTQGARGIPDLFERNHVEKEGVHATPAVLLGDLEPVDAELRGGLVDLARDEAGVLPRVHVGDDFALHEVADDLAEGLVVLVKNGAFHGCLLVLKVRVSAKAQWLAACARAGRPMAPVEAW